MPSVTPTMSTASSALPTGPSRKRVMRAPLAARSFTAFFRGAIQYPLYQRGPASPIVLGVARGRDKLFPHIRVGGPFRIFQAGNLQLFDVQRAVAIRTDVFHARPAQEQHATPGTGLDGHAQTAEAHAAAIPLVQDAEVNQPCRKEEQQAHYRRVQEIENET